MTEAEIELPQNDASLDVFKMMTVEFSNMEMVNTDKSSILKKLFFLRTLLIVEEESSRKATFLDELQRRGFTDLRKR